MIKNISLILMTVFYLVAGINHFLHPENYYALIPPYFPFHQFINMVSGAAEIIFGGLLIFPSSRKAFSSLFSFPDVGAESGSLDGKIGVISLIPLIIRQNQSIIDGITSLCSPTNVVAKLEVRQAPFPRVEDLELVEGAHM